MRQKCPSIYSVVMFLFHRCEPHMKCGTQLHIPKRIKSAAHLIVNCNIKPNWNPITFDRIHLNAHLFFSQSVSYLIESKGKNIRMANLKWNVFRILCQFLKLHTFIFNNLKILPTCCNIKPKLRSH